MYTLKSKLYEFLYHQVAQAREGHLFKAKVFTILSFFKTNFIFLD